MVVRQLESGDTGRWNDFVHGHPEATFFHLNEWRTVIERAFGHETYYMLAEDDGRICGVLPLGRIRSRIFGDTLISVPFGVYGGILATDNQAHEQLVRSARELAERLGVDCLELRNRVRTIEDWPYKDLYVSFRRALDPDPEANLKSIPRKQRAMVRRGIKAGLQGVIDEDPDRFFRIYSESVRNLGTPVFSRKLFEVLCEVLGDKCEVLTVLHDGRAVGSVMSFYFRDEVLPYYGGAQMEARAVAANDFMYWELMRRACEKGVRIFDYGRSKRDTGSYRFKKHWGFEPEPLFYECSLVRAKALPEVNPLNPKYAAMIATWKRLPLSIANVLGPMISRNLG